jgi:hypothetical protein
VQVIAKLRYICRGRANHIINTDALALRSGRSGTKRERTSLNTGGFNPKDLNGFQGSAYDYVIRTTNIGLRGVAQLSEANV